ncbi:hypothetical protein NT6N_40020 [Oceaniferula spumae]|uniref:Wax synthase domain-containing protein n=1 Tax=Oceaniferula spumae TaxID=2979115 RepID=A0AAT9FS34_9BACT
MIDYLYSFLLALAFLAISRVGTKRYVLWPGLLIVLTLVHVNHLADHPFARMVVICSVLLMGMKGIVLAEWGRYLTWPRWFAFTILWFGMDPTPFAAEKRKLRWKKDAMIGLSFLLVGLALSTVVAYMPTDSILIMFVPMSLGFHYGALRLLTAFWRMQGIAVRPLFRNPLLSRGLADFWAKRWNLSFSQMMARAVQRPLVSRLGKRPALFAVFLVSGLLHELAITVPVQSGYGLPTLYFILHGLVVLIEKPSWPLWFSRALALLLVAAPLPFLFPPVFTENVIRYTLNYLQIF